MLKFLPFFKKRSRGISLMELIVSIGVMSIVMVGAFTVMREGVSLVRTNQRAADAQVSVLQALGHITTESVNAKSELIEIYGGGGGGSTLAGLVFASPLKDDGGVTTDPDTGETYWQKWICFYYEPGDATAGTYGKILRCEEKIPANPSTGSGTKNIADVEAGLTTRTPDYFQANPQFPRKLMGNDISGFQIEKYSGDLDQSGTIDTGLGESSDTFHDSYVITVEAGDKDNKRSDGYYIQVGSQVTPRG